MKLSFIGTGVMGGAIARAVCAAAEPAAVYVSNRSLAKAEALAEELGCNVCPTNPDCARDADYIFLGVKPNMIRDVLREIAPVLHSGQVIVSMAAGVTGDAMRETLTEASPLLRTVPIVRILPNTPCAIGKGLMLIAPCGEVSPEALTALSSLLAPCGLIGYTDEAHADAGMVVGGCTPAYTYMFIEALADGAVRCGLPRQDALAWAAQSVAGAAELLLKSGVHPGALKDAVCSPGGSTIEGVLTLEAGAFRGTVMDAVGAAWEKTKALGK